uniref:Uncharacterized protein n=1 Tax=Anguilla anguilla TaxID=7936 RepID=A0A0E9SSV8_ANGAN
MCLGMFLGYGALFCVWRGGRGYRAYGLGSDSIKVFAASLLQWQMLGSLGTAIQKDKPTGLVQKLESTLELELLFFSGVS